MLALEINIIGTLSGFVIATIGQLGYARVLIAIGLESACIPLPSEVIMPFAGYVAWEGTLTLFGVAVAGTLGCLAGSLSLIMSARLAVGRSSTGMVSTY